MPPLPNDGDVERRKLLVTMTSAKVTKLEEALEGNWVAHVVLAGIGFALVYGVANLPKLLSEYFIKGDYDKKGVAAITLAILLYYFMKLGHLLSSYADVTDLQKALIDNFHQPLTLPLRKSTSFLAEAFSDESYQSNSFWPYLLVTTAVVTLAQASALFLVVQAYGTNVWLPAIFLGFEGVLVGNVVRTKKRKTWSVVRALGVLWALALSVILFATFRDYGLAAIAQLLAETIIATLYLLFWSSQKHRRQASWVVLSSLVGTCGWLFLFAATLR
jgi:hypothetical protein